MIDYSKLKPGQKLIALQTGLWGFTKANETILMVKEVNVGMKKCTVENAQGRTMYFEGDHAASLLAPHGRQEDAELGAAAQALQAEILDLVGRNAKLGADLTAVTELLREHQAVIEDHRRLAGELDVALCGTSGAAKQASLCDILGMMKDWRRRHGIADADPLPMFAIDFTEARVA